MAKSKLRYIFILFGILSLIFVLYSKILKAFFQQDEWFSYGYYVLHRNLDAWGFVKFFFAPNVGHYNPLTVAVQQFLFSFWNLNYTNFAILGIVLHLLTVITFYLFANRIFREQKLLVFISTALFGLFSTTYQAVAWVVADISTLSSSILGLVSTILFVSFLNTKRTRTLVLCMVMFFVSLLFKEITIGLLPLFFIIYMFKEKGKVSRRHLTVILLPGLIYFLLRVVMYFTPGTVVPGSVVTQSEPLSRVLYDLVTSPIKTISYTLVPEVIINKVSVFIAQKLPKGLTGIPGTTAFDLFVLTRVMELSGLVLGLIVIVVSLIIYFKNRRSKNGFVILFALLWTLLNSLIFALSPGTDGVTIPDSRNLYFASIGVSILITSIIFHFTKGEIKKTILIIVPFLLIHIFFLNKNLNTYKVTGNIRRQILEQIKNRYPQLPRKVVFYTESDKSYYGLPENEKIMPFQSGFGQTLLAWYEDKEKFPASFFEDRFLWNINSQGYKEEGGVGFGYFRDFEKMIEFFKTTRLNLDSLIAFRYSSTTGELEDISKQVQGWVKGYLSQKREILLNKNNFVDLPNKADLGNLIDNNIRTIWDSKIPYANTQTILVDLYRSVKVAEITIDPYNSRDQGKVVYSVMISDDGKNWKEVLKKVDFNQDGGIFKLYFSPASARYFKIVQIGSNKSADWIIAELKMYEAIN